uniref:Uncharacterized protein n=1 Tax=Escherichia coli TaxID=562 RepID=A0A8A4RXI6_ECOLX|nr:hypothetical protein [Escherichia coli]
MLHKDKQEYHEHLFSGVSGLFLSWSSDTLPPIPFHAQGTRFTGRF